MMQTMESPHGKRSLRDKTVNKLRKLNLEIYIAMKAISVDALVYYEHDVQNMELTKSQQY